MPRHDAVIVAVHPSGESTLVVDLLTRDAGRMGCVARGARRSKHRFAGGLDVLMRVDVDEEPPRKGELHELREAVVTQDFQGLRRDPLALGRAAYIAELSAALTPRNQESLQTFELLLEALRLLSSETCGPALLRWVEAHVLMMTGELSPPDCCAACGTPLNRVVRVTDDSPGHLFCLDCSPANSYALPPSEAALLVDCTHWSMQQAARATVTEMTSVAVGRRLAPLVRHAVGHPLKSKRFLAQLQRFGHGAAST